MDAYTLLLTPLRKNGNPGRGYDSSCDFKTALANHYDPTLAIENMKETHKLLQKAAKPLGSQERVGKGWDAAYDLRPWTEFPDTERVMANIPSVVFQNISGGWFGAGAGPTKETVSTGNSFRELLQNSAGKISGL